MTNEEDVEKKKGSMIFSLVSYVSINCIRFTGIISAQSTPTNNGVQSIYFVGEGQGDCNISTHSHPKVAARFRVLGGRIGWSFNTQPPEGGCLSFVSAPNHVGVSTHSHPKVAACRDVGFFIQHGVSTHSHPKVAASGVRLTLPTRHRFQHTATRRWLPGNTLPPALVQRGFNTQPPEGGCLSASTVHSTKQCFNTQPPEGGCCNAELPTPTLRPFQHTATRRWLHNTSLDLLKHIMFQHTATRRWLHH